MAPPALIPDAAPSESLTLRLVTNPAAYPLLDLPRELRDMIWAYTLLEPRKWDRRHKPGCSFYDLYPQTKPPPFALTEGYLKFRRDDLPPVPYTDSTNECSKRRGLGLLGTNRQIRFEAEQIFWPATTFCVDGPWVFWARTEKVPSVWPKVRQISFMNFRPDEGEDVRLHGGKVFQILRQMPALSALEVPRSFVESRMIDLMALPALKTLKVLDCELAHLALWQPRGMRLWMALGRDFLVPHCYGVVHTQQQLSERWGIAWIDESKACQVCLPAWRSIRHCAFMMREDVFGDDDWEARLGRRLSKKDVSQTAERAIMMPVRLRGTRHYLYAEVWGLPTRPVSEHKRLYFRELGRKRTRAHGLVSSASGEDDYSSKSKPAKSQRYRQQRIEADGEAKAQRRAEKKTEEAKHELTREKSECKKRRKEIRKGIEQMQTEKKAASRRCGR